MTKTGIIVLAIIIVLAGVIGYGVYKGNQAPDTVETPGVTPTPTPTATPTPTTTSEGTVKSFTINGSNFSFSPSAIVVNKGDTVKITFKNTGGFHDLKIDEFNVATQRIDGNNEETVTFVADKTGSFEYYCSVGTHRQMGMKGTLTVN